MSLQIDNSALPVTSLQDLQHMGGLLMGSQGDGSMSHQFAVGVGVGEVIAFDVLITETVPLYVFVT